VIYVTQLVYVHEGCEADFQQFEDAVLPLLDKYRGELVLRLRPDRASRIGGSAETPYEVHVVRFDSEADLTAYASDTSRQRVLHLKDKSVRAALTIRGVAEGRVSRTDAH
jgi:hypothetical protein